VATNHFALSDQTFVEERKENTKKQNIQKLHKHGGMKRIVGLVE